MSCFEVFVEKIDVAAGHLEAGMPENLLKLEDTAAVSQELNGEAAPERVPALSQPAPAPSRLPRLRHLRGARGDRVRARRSRLGELMRAARATGSR